MSLLLTKSGFLLGRQCDRRLWLNRHGQREPSIDPDEVWEDREAEGAAVEEQAATFFPDAVRIAPAPEVEEAPFLERLESGSAATTAALAAHRTVLQAHVEADGLLAVCDVLEPRGAGWYVWEIKASTSMKPLFAWDLAFQAEVLRRRGLDVVGAGVIHLDPDYVRGEVLDPEGLLRREDLTGEVLGREQEVRSEIERQSGMLRGDDVPEARPGPRCKGNRNHEEGRRPSACGHLTSEGYCGSRLPEDWAGRLPNLKAGKAAAVAGMPDPRISLLDPNDPVLNWTPLQRRVIEAVRSGEAVILREPLVAALERLEYPVAYVDFEFDPALAIPRFAGMKPYGRLPFQWSLCMQRAPGAELESPRSFLHTRADDPRAEFVRSLLDELPDRGSVAVYSRGAEITVLRQLSGVVPELDGRIEGVIDRVYDVLDLVKAGYYDPAQAGSFSIKKVAPALVGRGYGDLDIQNGMAAVVLRREALGLAEDSRRHQEIRSSLIRYCGRDAELMHAIVERARALVSH